MKLVTASRSSRGVGLGGADPGHFDAIISYSSIEHAGLGRYGEPINPWGDLQTLGLIWCNLKPGQYFFLGPNCVDSCGWLDDTTSDMLYFNAQRDYQQARMEPAADELRHR